MAWALASGLVGIRGCELRVVFNDIESLNREALQGDPDLTALSAAAYPAVANTYRVLRCGASFGADYGPVVVGRESREPGPAAFAGMRVGIPGKMTSAYLLLRIFSSQENTAFEPVAMPFDRIQAALHRGEIDAGLLIHEGQMTFERDGLHLLFEPARYWTVATGLPVPLGLVVLRRDLAGGLGPALASAFTESIQRALANRPKALNFAARYARGLDAETLEAFVDRYVDDLTLDMGARGKAALRRFYAMAHEAGLLAVKPPLDLA